MYRLKFLIIVFTFLLMTPVLSWGQTAMKPRYAPRKEKHLNHRDEIDRKQGLWKHYNYLGTLTWEVEYLNDRKHGLSRRYFGNGLIMKETEYQYGKKEGIFRRFNYNGVASEGEFLEGKKADNGSITTRTARKRMREIICMAVSKGSGSTTTGRAFK